MTASDVGNFVIATWLATSTVLAIHFAATRGRARYYVNVETGWILKTRGTERELDAVERALAPNKFRRCDATEYERQQERAR